MPLFPCAAHHDKACPSSCPAFCHRGFRFRLFSKPLLFATQLIDSVNLFRNVIILHLSWVSLQRFLFLLFGGGWARGCQQPLLGYLILAPTSSGWKDKGSLTASIGTVP